MRSLAWGDHLGTHLGASLITGLVSTTLTNPVDVVKTVMFVHGSRSSVSGGPLACAALIVRRDGWRGLFRGWSANYARLGPQTVITFVVNEKLRELLGMGGF